MSVVLGTHGHNDRAPWEGGPRGVRAPGGRGKDWEKGPHYRSAGAPPLLSVSSLRWMICFTHTRRVHQHTHTHTHTHTGGGKLRAPGQDLEISGDLAERGKRGNRERKLERSDWRGYRGTEGLKHGRTTLPSQNHQHLLYHRHGAQKRGWRWASSPPIHLISLRYTGRAINRQDYTHKHSSF